MAWTAIVPPSARPPHERYQVCYQDGPHQRSAGIFPTLRRAEAERRALERAGREPLPHSTEPDPAKARILFVGEDRLTNLAGWMLADRNDGSPRLAASWPPGGGGCWPASGGSALAGAAAARGCPWRNWRRSPRRWARDHRRSGFDTELWTLGRVRR
jgi:hypothetical protein